MMQRNYPVTIPGLPPFGIGLAIGDTGQLGCHARIFSNPSVCFYNSQECKRVFLAEEMYKAGLIIAKDAYPKFGANWGKFADVVREHIYKCLAQLVLESMNSNNSAIAIMSDHLEGDSLITIRGLVRYLLTVGEWAGWASPIVNNPQHSTKGNLTFCQVWTLIPPNKFRYAARDTDFAVKPKDMNNTLHKLAEQFVSNDPDLLRYLPEDTYKPNMNSLDKIMEQFKFFDDVAKLSHTEAPQVVIQPGDKVEKKPEKSVYQWVNIA